ncbi:hypothetical protein JGU66_12455 [Myxococcaceae bacterium JPH2]|nr:hypothetical protein [Myxococcaceae bacterium JPH2]
MNRLRGIVGCVAVVALGCGTGEKDSAEKCAAVRCAPCAPALSVRFKGVEGRGAPEVTLSTQELKCQPDGLTTVCTTTAARTGKYAFDVSAPGYVSERVETEVRVELMPLMPEQSACCTCGYTAVSLDVQLRAPIK